MSPKFLHLNEAAEQAAHEAIELAILQYFQVRECIVHLDTLRACILFNTREHQQWIVRFNGHIPFHGESEIPVSVPLDELPQRIRLSAQPVLERIMARHENFEYFRKWKSVESKVVSGIITESTATHYTISLKGGTGIMDQRDTIETEIYDLATSHLFHVKRVRIDGDKVRICLSRRSKTLPEYVLKRKFPKYKFHCFRRIPGARAWIRTTAPRYRWGSLISNEIRKPLPGEYLQFCKWHKGANHG